MWAALVGQIREIGLDDPAVSRGVVHAAAPCGARVAEDPRGSVGIAALRVHRDGSATARADIRGFIFVGRHVSLLTWG